MDEHIQDLIPGYTLGALDDSEAQRVEAHLATCPGCQAELRAYRQAAGALAFAVPQVTPPARVKARVMARVNAAGIAGASRGDRRARLRELLALRLPVPAAAGLALAALLLVAALALGLALGRASQPAGEFTVVAMSGTQQAPGASGLLVISGEGRDGTLIVDGLSGLGAQQQYQLWLIRGSAAAAERVSGGVFSVDEQGYGALVVKAPGKLSDFTDFGITIEPAGGSPGPTGSKVLGGGR